MRSRSGKVTRVFGVTRRPRISGSDTGGRVAAVPGTSSTDRPVDRCPLSRPIASSLRLLDPEGVGQFIAKMFGVTHSVWTVGRRRPVEIAEFIGSVRSYIHEEHGHYADA